MKSILKFIALCMTLCLSSCYDDSALWQSVKEHEERIVKLEALCDQMNTNIISLQTVITALQDNDYVTNIAPIKENNKEIGYAITFAKSGSITIYHGQDGKDGVTPTISVMKDIDGIYYWTVNNEWLLVNGQKIKASATDGVNGVDGITPKFKIEEDYWYISYDNGESWEKLGKASVSSDNQINCLFKSVIKEDNCVIFTLSDDTIVSIPFEEESQFSILFDETDDVFCESGKAVEIPFQIFGGNKVSMECVGENGWIGKIKMTGNSSGIIEVTAPNPANDGKILVFATNDSKEIIMKTLTFTDKIMKSVNDLYQVSYLGGNLEITVRSSLDYTIEIPENVMPWLTYVETKSLRNDVIVLSVAENLEEMQRIAEIKLISQDESKIQVITILQKGAPSAAIIEFADPVMKQLCIDAFDKSGDGELSYKEAASVTDLSLMSLSRFDITSFDEFQYFVNVREIPDSYFTKTKLVSIILPDGLEIIGNHAFENCDQLAEIVIPNTVMNIRAQAFYGCNSLETIDLPDNLTVISWQCFYYCANLKTLELPETITSIARQAFDGCYKLSSIRIPKNVTYIGNMAFYACYDLSEVYIESETPPSLEADGSLVFGNNASSRLIYVQYTILSDYKSDINWVTLEGSIIGYDFQNEKIVEN